MIFVTLSVTMNNYAQMKPFIQPLHDTTSCQVFFAADNEDTQARLQDFKPPKHSFINYETLFNNDLVMPAYLPQIAGLMSFPAFRAPTEVFLDILIPPGNLS